jgi:hypothetical protein
MAGNNLLSGVGQHSMCAGAHCVASVQAVDKSTLMQLRGNSAKGYAFDRRYGAEHNSDNIYDDCVKQLVDNLFKVSNRSCWIRPHKICSRSAFNRQHTGAAGPARQVCCCHALGLSHLLFGSQQHFCHIAWSYLGNQKRASARLVDRGL